MRLPLLRPDAVKDPRRAANRRTALILMSIALVFFGGVIAAQYTGGTTIGIGVVGFGIIGFLLVVIARSGRR
jgi:hypothetical protein